MKGKSKETQITQFSLRAERVVNSRGLRLVAKTDAQAHWRHDDIKFRTSVRLHRLTHESSRWFQNSLQHEGAPFVCSTSVTALRSTPPQSTIHSMGRRAPMMCSLSAPHLHPSAPQVIGIGAGWVGLNQPLISASSSQVS